MNIQNKLTAGLIAILAGVVVAPLQAATLSVSSKGGWDQNVTINYNGTNETTQAGTLTLQLDPTKGNFDGYCVDLAHAIYLPTSYPVTLSTTSALGPGGGEVGWLFTNNEPGIAAETDSTKRLNEGAALQLAIWEATENGPTTNATTALTSGTFQYQTPGAVQTLAQGYLQSWITAGSPTGSTGYMVVGSTGQSMIGGYSPNYNSVNTPEPGPISLGCSALVMGSVLVRRRITRRK